RTRSYSRGADCARAARARVAYGRGLAAALARGLPELAYIADDGARARSAPALRATRRRRGRLHRGRGPARARRAARRAAADGSSGRRGARPGARADRPGTVGRDRAHCERSRRGRDSRPRAPWLVAVDSRPRPAARGAHRLRGETWAAVALRVDKA